MNPKDSRAIRLFLVSSGCIFIVTGLAKLISATGGARILLTPDPVFGVPFRDVFLIVGLIEILVAFFCLFGGPARVQASLVVCLSTDFAIYRFGLWLLGWHRPCSCLGNLTDAIHIKPEAADAAMAIILVYLMVGSYGSVYWLWRGSGGSGDRLWGRAAV